jgi:phage terminase large subunit-like protein
MNYDQYADSVLSGEVPACLFVRQACERFKKDLKRKDLTFDRDRVDMAIGFAHLSKHTKGKWKGEPFRLEPWQKFIFANLFGFYTLDGNRRYRKAYLEMPKKNGKSPMAAVIANYMLTMDGENSPECYSIATTTDQAAISWKYSKNMLEYLKRDFPDQFDSFSAQDSFNNKVILFGDNDGLWKPLSFGENERHDGLSVSFGLIDEYHAHKNNRGYKILSDGTSARENSLILAITTAGFDTTSACYQHRGHCEGVLSGKFNDDSLFALIYTIDEGDDWRTEEAWKKANPNYGVSVFREGFTADLPEAKESGEAEVAFKTKKLNQWVSSYATWKAESLIVRRDTGFVPELGAKCWGGLDLASSSDFTSLTFDFKLDMPGKDYHRFVTRYYMPSLKLRLWKGQVGEDLRKWAEMGFITVTEGDTTDYDFIEQDFMEFIEKYEVVSVGYDIANSKQFAAKINEQYPELMRPFPQTLQNMNFPTRKLGDLIDSGDFEYDGNPVTRWMFGNVRILMGPNDNIRIVKSMKGDPNARDKKVDGPITWVMSVGEAIDMENQGSGWVDSYTL